MLRIMKRISFCSLAFLFITAGAFGARSSAAPLAGQDARRHLHNTSRRRPVASEERSKLGRRTIIFAGGKKGRHGLAKRSNPGQAKKVNRGLNPQPIPPGKQRRPE